MIISLRTPDTKSKTHYRYKTALSIIILCFTYYVCIRGVTGYFYIPAGTINATYQIGGNTFATIVLYLGLLISVILGLKEYKRSYNQKFLLLSIIMFIPIFLWCIIDMFQGHSLRSLLGITTICPLTFFMFFAVYIGMNPIAWQKVVEICNKLSVVFVAMSAIATIMFYLTYGAKNINNSPQIIFLSIGFIPLAIRVLLSEKTSNFVNILVLVIALLCAIFYNSRGWMIQFILLIAFYFFIRNKRYSFTKKILFIFFIVLALIIMIYVAKQIMPDRIESMLNKFDTGLASRTWQYNDLLSQYCFTDLLIGKGSFATYDTDIYGTFMYFDNAFVNITMKYGVLVSILFLITLVKTPLKLLTSKRVSSETKYPAIVLLLFFAAIMGVSVYFVVTVDLKFFLIAVLLGRCEYLYKNRSSYGKDVKTNE